MGRFRTIPLCLLLLLATGCGRTAAVPSAEEPPPAPEAVMEETVPVLSPQEIAALERQAEQARLAEAVEARLNSLSLADQVGQLFFLRCPQTDTVSYVEAYHPGGILLFTRDYQDLSGNWLTADDFTAKLAAMQAASRQSTGVSLFIGSDEEGGSVTRASRNPNLFAKKLPAPQKLYESGGMEHLTAETADFNSHLRAYGVNVNFAPVCDLSIHGADFIYDRTLGQNAETTADYAAQFVSVLSEAGMGSVLKHFPGYGNNADTHTGIAVDQRPYEQFLSEDYLPFRAGVGAGAPFVLVSHNIVTCLDDTLPASLSPAWHDQLRTELGFEGVILTDDLDMGAVKAYADGGSIAVTALLAGNDMIVCSDVGQIAAVLEAVENGTLSEECIRSACRRVLTVKQQLNLL